MNIKTYITDMLAYVLDKPNCGREMAEAFYHNAFGALSFYELETRDYSYSDWWENEIRPAFEKLIYNF